MTATDRNTTTEAQHTPGPWHVEANGGDDSSPEKVFVCIEAGDPVASTRGFMPEQDEANACLIAAAPDLLAAIQAGLAQNALQCSFAPQADDPCVCCCGKPKAYHWKAAARAAIAKATKGGAL